MLLDDLHDAILGAEREIRIQYRYRVLTDFAAFLGLVTLQRLSDDLTPEYAVTALPLVFELVEFRRQTQAQAATVIPGTCVFFAG